MTWNLDLQLEPDDDSDTEMVAGGLAVSDDDAPPILDAAEVILDLARSAAISLGTPDFPDGIAVVSLVGGNGERWAWGIQNLFDHLAVMDLTARHDQVQRTAFAIDERVGFRAAPSG